MNKIIFVLRRREGITLEEFLREWSSERHISIVQAVPGLTRWVQNHVVPDPEQGEPFCDGIGELWFESAEAVPQALQSQEFAAAVEDAQSFVDFDRTGLLVVNEKATV
jgi:uncharacterized protein (TIGR02118 family)